MRIFNLRAHCISSGLNKIYSLIVCCGCKFGENKSKGSMLADALKVVYKYILEEDPELVRRCLKIAGLLGRFMDTNVLLPMLISHLTDKESKNRPIYVSSCLAVLSEVVANISAQTLDPHLSEVVNLITSSDYSES